MATVLVAAGVAIIQSFAKNRLGTTLTSQEMRKLIVATGNKQLDRRDSYFCDTDPAFGDSRCTARQNENFATVPFTVPAAKESIGKFVNVANAVRRLKRRKLAGIRSSSKSITATSKTISVYPNPVSNVLQINGTPDIVASILYTLEGQTVGTFNTNNIELSGYAPGHYLLKIAKGDNSFTTKSIVIE